MACATWLRRALQLDTRSFASLFDARRWRSSSCWPPRRRCIAQPMELDVAMSRLERLMPAFELPTPPAAPSAPPLLDMPAPTYDWALPAVAFDTPTRAKGGAEAAAASRLCHGRRRRARADRRAVDRAESGDCGPSRRGSPTAAGYRPGAGTGAGRGGHPGHPAAPRARRAAGDGVDRGAAWPGTVLAARTRTRAAEPAPAPVTPPSTPMRGRFGAEPIDPPAADVPSTPADGAVVAVGAGGGRHGRAGAAAGRAAGLAAHAAVRGAHRRRRAGGAVAARGRARHHRRRGSRRDAAHRARLARHARAAGAGRRRRAAGDSADDPRRHADRAVRGAAGRRRRPACSRCAASRRRRA